MSSREMAWPVAEFILVVINIRCSQVKGQFAKRVFPATFVTMFKPSESDHFDTQHTAARTRSDSRPRRSGRPSQPVQAAEALVKLHDKQSERDYRELRIDKVG